MKQRLISLLLLTGLLPAALLAQSPETADEEMIPRYDVEIILFKNVKVPNSREFVLPASSPGKTDNMLDLSSSTSLKAASEQGYELLESEELRLLDLVERLAESSRYELLLHTGWRQPGLERDQVMPVWIKAGRIYGNEYTSIDSEIEIFESKLRTGADSGEDSVERVSGFDEQSIEAQELQLMEKQTTVGHGGLYELEGKISIVLSRYLHVYTDLVLRRPRLAADSTTSSAASNAYAQANRADTLILNNHHLRQHRRMRSKNLHYLDSPEFGMLIMVTPFEVAAGFEEAPIEAEAEVEPEAEEIPAVAE